MAQQYDYYGRPIGPSTSTQPQGTTYPSAGGGQQDYYGRNTGPAQPISNNSQPVNLGQAAPSEKQGMPNNNAPAPAPTLPPSTAPIFPQDPIPFGSGHYNPNTAQFGWDMSQPGYQEQFWLNNQNLWLDMPGIDWASTQLDQFKDPWAGELATQQLLKGMNSPSPAQQAWNDIRGKFNTMSAAESALAGGYRGPNNAQAAFDITKSRLPQSFQPQFDAYYDRMKQKVMGDVNSQSAARGVYGSNTALNNSIGAGLDVEANRAKALTDFQLADSANQRQWLDSLSGQGRTADLTGLDIFGANEKAARYGLDRTKTYGDLAFQADTKDVERTRAFGEIASKADELKGNRLTGGADLATGLDKARHDFLEDAYRAASGAQSAREGRITGVEGELGEFTDDVVNFTTEFFDEILGGDQAISDEQLRTMIAKEADQRGWSQHQQDRVYDGVRLVTDAVNGSKAAKEAKGET